VVLYEMLTGKQLYTGENAAETLAWVMTKEPSLDALPSNTPLAIRNLLRRCLEKDPRQRLQHIGEARIAIEAALSATAPAEPEVRAFSRLGCRCASVRNDDRFGNCLRLPGTWRSCPRAVLCLSAGKGKF
jgi:serine/threonine protein kinase